MSSWAVLYLLIPCFSVTDACNPRHHYRHVMTEEGKQPIFYPVDDYSSCCPPADQRISHVQVTNVTIPTSTGGGSQWLPDEYTFGLSIFASVKNNQIELNVSTQWSTRMIAELLWCCIIMYLRHVCIKAYNIQEARVVALILPVEVFEQKNVF